MTVDRHEQAVYAALAEHGHGVSLPRLASLVKAINAVVDPGSKGWFVDVYCREPSHDEKCWNIGTFTIVIGPGAPSALPFELQMTGSLPRWRFVPKSHSRSRGRLREHRIQKGDTSRFSTNAQHLVGDRLVPKLHEPGEFTSEVDERYPLKCGACDLSVPWRQSASRRDDALQLLLDDYAIAGVSEIPLRVIAATLNS
jgi:hypothetical protein